MALDLLRNISIQIIAILLGSVFFTVFVHAENILLHTYIQQSYFGFLVCLGVISIAMLRLSGTLSALSINKIDIAIILFYLTCIVSLWGFQQSLNNNKFISLTFLSLFYFLTKYFIANIIKARKIQYLKILVILYLVTALLQGTLGLLQLYAIIPSLNPAFKITGTFLNPSPFAFFIACSLTIAVGIYLFIKEETITDKILKHLSGLTIISAVIVLPATQNRASWIASFIGTILILNHKFKILSRIGSYLNTQLKRSFSILILFSTIIITSYVLYHFKPDSAYGRTFRWKVTLSLILEKPLLGHGYSSFPVKYNNQQSHWFSKTEENLRDKMIAGDEKFAYSEYLEILAELGILGLLIFTSILYLSLKIKLKNVDATYLNIRFVVVSAMITICIMSAFSYALSSLSILIIFYFLLALNSVLTDNEKDLPHKNKFLPSFITYAIIAASIGLGRHQYTNYYNYQNWAKARHFQEIKNYLSATTLYHQNYQFLNKNGEFLKDYGICLFQNSEFKKSIKILKEASRLYSNPNLFIAQGNNYDQLNNYKTAIELYLFADHMIPQRFYPKYKLVSLYMKNREYNKAIILAKKIQIMEVKINSPAVRQIKKEMEILLRENDLTQIK